MSPEQHRPNFKSIGEKLQSGEVLEDVEKTKVFSVALKYAEELVGARLDATDKLLIADKNVLVEALSWPKDAKDYLSAAVLGRIVNFHNSAIKGNITGADASVKFGELREALCKKLSICVEVLPDEKLTSFLEELTGAYLDKAVDSGVSKYTPSVRKAASLIVADNPTTRVDRGPNLQAID